jgi:hypothetical protein
MGVLERFDPPAYLSDFDGIPGQRLAWHRFLMACFDQAIASEQTVLGPNHQVQFFNPVSYDPGGVLLTQPIVWNAFPKELLRTFGRAEALRQADQLWPLRQYRNSTTPGSPLFEASTYRPQVEYCEWHVTRDPDSNKIKRVTFTSEPPEFWSALAGTAQTVAQSDGTMLVTVPFPGDIDRLVDLYRHHISPAVQRHDLFAESDITSPIDGPLVRKGDYNPYNKWNTVYGAMHLCAPPNSISAEIQLGADATILYVNGKKQAVVEPQALVCCAAYGGPDRNSDPTIGATVNALARLGAMVTLPNPVGLYMDHIDLSGWHAPDAADVSTFVHVARGQETMIERLVVETPPESPYLLGDVTIGGEPIQYGGQIAECITVKLVGAAGALGAVQNRRMPCTHACCLDAANATSVARPQIEAGEEPPPGMTIAFAEEGAVTMPAVTTRVRAAFGVRRRI